jgi:hypothetical protein
MPRHPAHWFASLFSLSVVLPTAAADWPMWRCDAGRSGETTEQLPETLHLQWVRTLPALAPAFHSPRLQFDRGYEPVVAGGRLFLGSSRSDAVTALDTKTGRELWRFYAAGPVRLAPVAWRDRVYFGSDDGRLYCLNAADGSVRWTFTAVPSARQLLGNGRMISVWPVRGGPVLRDGRLYFAAGVWPFEGVFVYALDAETGNVIWRNDRLGYLHGVHPHGATAIGGVTPQGYLLIDGDTLIVPCGTAYPAVLELATGQLKSFQLPEPGRVPGGWFAALNRAQRRGEEAPAPLRLTYDSQINSDRHEDDWRTGQGQPEVRGRVRVGTREYRFRDGLPGLTGEVHSLLAADGKLFAVTVEGQLACFGPEPRETAKHASAPQLPGPAGEPWVAQASRLLEPSGRRHGHALVLGAGSGQLVECLLRESALQVLVIEPQADRAAALRERWDRAGWYGPRVAILSEEFGTTELPPYFATLIAAEGSPALGGPVTADRLARLFQCLRPYGGAACFNLAADESARFRTAAEAARLEGAELGQQADVWQLTRPDALAGATNYTVWFQASPDERVRAPLGVLWYADDAGFFKRSPPPVFADGLMRAYDQLWMGYPDGDRPPYKLAAPTYQDVYTGRVLAEAEVAQAAALFPPFNAARKQPNQYRPATQRDPWKPEPPVAGQRTNPLTGQSEPRRIPKSYGCDGGFDYGGLYTMRSGTAAFYDKRLESGTISISGPRSGCTNSIVPACGLLNLPYFYKGCTCSYPLPTSAALVSMPATYEQWSSWGAADAEPVGAIQRVGINFGAPGDRMTEAGTLWLDYPSVGGPSPAVGVAVEPASPQYFYQHSLFVRGGCGWPWVAASGVEGLTRATIRGLKPGRYVVRLYFAEPGQRDSRARVFDVSLQGQPGRPVGWVSDPTPERVFDVSLQGQSVLPQWDIVRAAGGALRVVVKQFDDVASDGALEVRFTPRAGQTLINGIEVVAHGLRLDALPRMPEAASTSGQLRLTSSAVR